MGKTYVGDITWHRNDIGDRCESEVVGFYLFWPVRGTGKQEGYVGFIETIVEGPAI